MSLETTVLRLYEVHAEIKDSFVRSYESYPTVRAKNQFVKDFSRIVNKRLTSYKDILEQTLEELNSSRLQLMEILTNDEYDINENTRLKLEEIIGMHYDEIDEEAVGDATEA